MSGTEIQEKMLSVSSDLTELVGEQKSLSAFADIDFQSVENGGFRLEDGVTVLWLKLRDRAEPIETKFTTNGTIATAFSFVAQQQAQENEAKKAELTTELQNLLNLMNNAISN